MPALPAIDVVVPTWNGRDRLPACLASLGSQDHPDLRILVVDDGSTDDTLRVLDESFPSAEVVRMDRNRGFAAAANAGARSGRAPYLAFLNDDCTAHPSWASALCRSLEGHPGCASAASRMVLARDPSRIDRAGDALGTRGLPHSLGHLEDDGEPFDHERFPLSASAGAALYRRPAFEAAGGFDERFIAYMEDVDLGLRLRLLGHGCVYSPLAVVHHQGGASTGGGITPFAVRHSTRNILVLLAKNLPGEVLLRTLPGLVLGQLEWFGKMAVKERCLLSWVRGFLEGAAGVCGARRRGRNLRRSSTLTPRDVLTLLRASGKEIAASVARKRRQEKARRRAGSIRGAELLASPLKELE